jgi:hypothetical protein
VSLRNCQSIAGSQTNLNRRFSLKRTSPKKPKLFQKLEFGNDTQEAFNAFEAEYKLREYEAQIREMFLYGAWADLPHGYGSMDGYRKFLEMRRQIRAERIRMKQEQETMQKKFWDDLLLYGGTSAVVIVGCLMLYVAIVFLGTQNERPLDNRRN